MGEINPADTHVKMFVATPFGPGFDAGRSTKFIERREVSAVFHFRLPSVLRRAPSDAEIERCVKAYKMAEADRLVWNEAGPFAEWNYRATLPSGNWQVLFHEGWDGTPRMGFARVGGYVQQDSVVSQQFGDLMYEVINLSLYGAVWLRAKRRTDEMDADLA